MRRSSAIVLGALLVSRIVIEAIAFGAIIAVAHALTGGVGATSLVVTVAAMLGVSSILVAALRDTSTERAGGAIVASTLVASVVLAIALPSRSSDAAAWLARAIVFAVVGETLLWRLISLARGAIRWTDARNAAPFAAVAVGIAAVVPVEVDRTPLAALALALVGACAVAMSLARATEELSLAGAASATAARLSSVTSILFALGVAAILVAVVAPYAERALADASGTIGSIFESVLLVLLLPLGYLAALFIYLIEPLFRHIDLSALTSRFPQRSPEEEQELLRQAERTRPLVFGGLELVIVLVVVAIALVVLERVVRERRLALPEGGELDRSSVDGLSLGETLRSLFPRRSAARGAPRDDGSPAAAIRILYWRLLALAERTGYGWREPAETPDEHRERLVRRDARWAAAAPIVSAFDELRYGEREPEPAAVARARDALQSVEAAIRT